MAKPRTTHSVSHIEAKVRDTLGFEAPTKLSDEQKQAHPALRALEREFALAVKADSPAQGNGYTYHSPKGRFQDRMAGLEAQLGTEYEKAAIAPNARDAQRMAGELKLDIKDKLLAKAESKTAAR